MSDDRDDKVVSPNFGAPNLDVRRRSFGDCRHVRVLVDADLRRVECRECGEILDPIEVLLQFASKERQFSYRKDALENIQRRVQELSKEERRIKARISRAKKKESAG